MELQYKKAMEEYGIKFNQLPEDARVTAENITDVLKGFALLERRGKAPKEKTIKLLKAMDKYVYYEILDLVHETDENNQKKPEGQEEMIEELEEEANGAPKMSEQDKIGFEIEAELAKMMETGTKEWSIEEVKGIAKRAYQILFDYYEEGAENGIVTSKYSLIETKPKVFTISAK